MFKITRIAQCSPTMMVATISQPNAAPMIAPLALDYARRAGDTAESLVDLGRKKLTKRSPVPVLTEALTVQSINSVDLDDDGIAVDCLLSNGINTVLYPLGGLSPSTIVYMDNDGTVYTAKTARECIECCSLLDHDGLLSPRSVTS